MEFHIDQFLPDITFKTSRSGGKGGQHVNKVSSKVELNFDFENSPVFNAVQKQRLREKLAARVTQMGRFSLCVKKAGARSIIRNIALKSLL